MRSTYSLALSAALLPLLAGPVAAVTLSNGTGDGDVTVEVSEFGFVFDAVFDPVGAVAGGDVVFSSYVARDAGEEIEALDFTASTAELVRQTDAELVTRFDVDDLRFTLTQRVDDVAGDGQRSGSVLTQEFAITNLSEAAAEFDLYRYMDGDLFLTDVEPGDGGGVMERDGRTVLFQTDAVGVPGPDNPFLGITAEGGTAPEEGRFSVGRCCGIDAPLDNDVEGDTDGDGVIDADPYDVTLALRNAFSLGAGQSATYTTSTIFGTGAPEAPPAPGSSEGNPLAPTNQPPVDGVVESFVFDIPRGAVADGQTVWIDPAVAVGYTYEATGGAFAAVTAPSLGTVADADGYTLAFGETRVALVAGETYAFAAPVSMFRILGIDPALALDPEGAVFVTGLAFANIADGISSLTVSKTPIAEDVDDGMAPIPLPASGLVLAGSLGALGALRRRRRAG